MTETSQDFVGEIRLGRQLSSATQAAASGVAVLIGVLILLSDQVLAEAGSRAPIAGLIVILVWGLTLLSVVEMLAGSGERGGTYMLVQEVLGGLLALLTGWALLIGLFGLGAALLIAAARPINNLLPLDWLDPTATAMVLLAGLLSFQLFQALPRRIQLRTVILGLLCALGLILLTVPRQITPTLSRATPARDLGPLLRSAAWLGTGYAAFEAVLKLRHQIREPTRAVPRALLITLAAGGLVLIAFLYWLARLSTPIGVGPNALATGLSFSSYVPDVIGDMLTLVGLILAANACLMSGIRQLYTLSFEGALPAGLRSTRGIAPLPAPLFLIAAVLTAPLVYWAKIPWLVNLVAAMFLFVMTILNISAIYSLRAERKRRRVFTVPFAPVVPALAIAANLILLRALPASVLTISLSWLALGGAFYFGYAQRRQIEAKEGEIVFGRPKEPSDTRPSYRILVPIGPGEERHLVLGMAAALSRRLGGAVIALQVIPLPDPLAIEEGRRTARERNILFRWSTRLASDVGVPMHPITRLARSATEGIIDTAIEEGCKLILMPWAVKEGREEGRIGEVLSQVIRDAPCDVAVIASHKDGAVSTEESADNSARASKDGENAAEPGSFQATRILVPTSGGVHAPLAIRLALLLAQEAGATVTAVYVAGKNATEGDLQEGERRIQETIQAMRRQAEGIPELKGEKPLSEIPIEGRVIQAPDVVDGISQAAEHYELVLMGATEESLVEQVLFGSIPEQVAQRSATPIVIVKRYRGLPRLWLTRAWDAIFEALPTLSDEEQIEVYRSVHRGSRPDADFFVMISLSTLIATFGLLQSSSAVIIGAMLVAPLFSPLLALSLAIVQGNIRLLRLAFESTLKGVALAIGLAILLSAVSPLKTLTPEILIRSQPNLTDLIVALASGAAGAYAIARKDVAAALPGVAIAAALVPPLGVIGIGMATANLTVAGGATLLILTNLVAIVLAGAITFLLLGFRPGGQGAREVHLRRGLLTAVGLFVLISIPLAAIFFRSVQTSRSRQTIQNIVTMELQNFPDIELVDPDEIELSESADSLKVTIPVFMQAGTAGGLSEALDNALEGALERPVQVRLVLSSVVETPP